MGQVAAAAVLIVTACGREPPVDLRRVATLQAPAEHRAGAALLATHCAACHGRNATGTGNGPPLVHDYYRPSHHGDAAFLLAAQRGVVAHHWRFGNMPPVAGVSDSNIAAITGYVRWLQQQAGIR